MENSEKLWKFLGFSYQLQPTSAGEGEDEAEAVGELSEDRQEEPVFDSDILAGSTGMFTLFHCRVSQLALYKL